MGEEKGEPAVGLGEGGSPGAWGQNRALPLATAAASEGGMAATCAAGSAGCTGTLRAIPTSKHFEATRTYRPGTGWRCTLLHRRRMRHMPGTCPPLSPLCQSFFPRAIASGAAAMARHRHQLRNQLRNQLRHRHRHGQPAALLTVPSTLSRPDPGSVGQRALHPPVAAPMAGLVRAFSCSRHPMATGPWRGYRRGTRSSGAEQQLTAPRKRACMYPRRYTDSVWSSVPLPQVPFWPVDQPLAHPSQPCRPVNPVFL